MVTELTPSARNLAIALFFACPTFLSARLITTPWVVSLAIPEIPDDPGFGVPSGLTRDIHRTSNQGMGRIRQYGDEPNGKRDSLD